MTPENFAMLQSWLESGDDGQKAHARHRLSLPDAIGYEPPAYPSAAAQVGSVARAVVDWAASGFKAADKAEQGRRMAICHACEYFDHSQSRCTKCGCLAALKSRIASSRCPVGKW